MFEYAKGNTFWCNNQENKRLFFRKMLYSAIKHGFIEIKAPFYYKEEWGKTFNFSFLQNVTMMHCISMLYSSSFASNIDGFNYILCQIII